MVGSLFSLLQFIVSPIIGRASDRLGRRTVLLYTMVKKKKEKRKC
jgi:MFS family permease